MHGLSYWQVSVAKRLQCICLWIDCRAIAHRSPVPLHGQDTPEIHPDWYASSQLWNHFDTHSNWICQNRSCRRAVDACRSNFCPLHSVFHLNWSVHIQFDYTHGQPMLQNMDSISIDNLQSRIWYKQIKIIYASCREEHSLSLFFSFTS